MLNFAIPSFDSLLFQVKSSLAVLVYLLRLKGLGVAFLRGPEVYYLHTLLFLGLGSLAITWFGLGPTGKVRPAVM
jgi:hypothetical protein